MAGEEIQPPQPTVHPIGILLERRELEQHRLLERIQARAVFDHPGRERRTPDEHDAVRAVCDILELAG